MKIEKEITKWTVIKTVAVMFIIFVAFFGGMTFGINGVFPLAMKQGYETALADIQGLLAQKDINFTWNDLGNGQYKIEIYKISSGKMLFGLVSEFHLLVQHYDSYGNLISETYHPMTTTDFGKDWVERMLFTDINYTENALWLATSNDETAVDTAWTILPSEITTAGLGREVGAYTSTGVGACNVTKTFSITGTISSCLYGVNADAYATFPNSLICAEQQGAGNRKNMNSGDSLKLTVQWSVSDI